MAMKRLENKLRAKKIQAILRRKNCVWTEADLKSSHLKCLKFISFKWGLAKHSKSCSTLSFTHWLSRTNSVVILDFKTFSVQYVLYCRCLHFLRNWAITSVFIALVAEIFLKHRSTQSNRLATNRTWLFLTCAVGELVMLDQTTLSIAKPGWEDFPGVALPLTHTYPHDLWLLTAGPSPQCSTH